jgi:hypothetical protein
MENQVKDDQYDQRNAKKPTEKIRHDMNSFRVEVEYVEYEGNRAGGVPDLAGD